MADITDGMRGILVYREDTLLMIRVGPTAAERGSDQPFGLPSEQTFSFTGIATLRAFYYKNPSIVGE